MTCDKYRSLLHDLLDGELPPRVARSMAEHETHCPYCAAFRVEMRGMLDGLANLDEDVKPPEEFPITWRQMLRGERRPVRIKTQGIKIWISVAAVLVILFGGTSLMRAGIINIDDDRGKGQPGAQTSGTSNTGENGAGGTDGLEAILDVFRPAVMQDGMKILRSSAYEISTGRFDEDMQFVMTLAKQVGGWVAKQSVSGEPMVGVNLSGRVGRLELRVPDESIQRFLTELSTVGKVTSSEITADDYSEQYREVLSRLEGYEELLTSHQMQFTQSVDPDEQYRLSLEIVDLQAKVDAARANIQNWDSREVFLQVDVTFTESAVAMTGGSSQLSSRMREHFTLSLRTVGSYFRDMFIFIAAAAPWVLLAAAMAAVALLIERLHWKSRQL